MLALLLLLTSVVGLQQAATAPATAEIVGTVVDRQGGVIPGVGLDIVRKIQQQPVEGQNLSGPITIGRVWRVGGK